MQMVSSGSVLVRRGAFACASRVHIQAADDRCARPVEQADSDNTGVLDLAVIEELSSVEE